MTDVSSQNTNSVHRSSATTSPSMAPANSVKYPANLGTVSEPRSPPK